MKTLGVVVALVAAQAGAQPKSLQEFLANADEQNVDRRLSLEQRQRSEAEFRAAWTALFPSLTASATWTHNQFEAVANFPNPATGMVNKLVIVPQDQLDAVLRLDVPLIDTTRWFRALAANTASLSATEREQLTRDLVKRQVVGAWYGYAAALAVRESARRSVGVAEAQLKLIDIRAGAGAATELEQMRAKAEVARTKQTVADVESLVATTRRTLQTVSFLEPPAEVALPNDDLHPEPPVASFEDRAGELPAVKAADRDAEAAGRLATASRLALVPIVSGQFTQRFTNATGFQNQSAVYNAGIGLQWRVDVPTFMNMQVQSQAESMAKLAAEKARLQARDQVFQDWNRLETARQKAELVIAQVAAAQRASQVAKDRYAVGVATQVDVIQAERDVFGAEVAQIQARTELATARAGLRLSAGLPLFPDEAR
ncbi:MAG: TolC family protein [Myxococcaceae bacterium]|nr:TolC family protein [Myxococcaceae bacterium]